MPWTRVEVLETSDGSRKQKLKSPLLHNERIKKSLEVQHKDLRQVAGIGKETIDGDWKASKGGTEDGR